MKCRGRRATPPPGISVSVIGRYPYPPPRGLTLRSAIAQLLPPVDERRQRAARKAVLADEEGVLRGHRPDHDGLVVVDQALDVLPATAEVPRVVDRVPADPARRAPRRRRAARRGGELVEANEVVDR